MNTNRMRRIALTVALTLLLLAAFAAALTSWVLLPRLDAMLSAAVIRELGLPNSATVEIQRGTFRQTMSGYLPGFKVDSASALVDGLELDYFIFNATGVDFNLHRILRGEKAEITAVDSAETVLRVPAGKLEQRLIPLIEAQGLKSPQLEFDDGTIKVTAKRKLDLLGSIKLAAKGRFVVDGTDLVRLRIVELEAGQLTIGIDKLGIEFGDNLPVLDLGGMFARVVIDDLKVTADYLQVSAHILNTADSSIQEKSLSVF